MFHRLLIAYTCVVTVSVLGKNLTLDECISRIGELGEIKERLQKLESVNNVSRIPSLQQGSQVAFYAQLLQNITHLGNHQTIEFDTVTTNIGGGYKPLIGTFSAPVKGTYVFFWLNTNRDLSFMNTELVKNGVVVGKSISDAMDHNDYAASSNTAVLQLKAGDLVLVRSGTWHSGVLAGDFYTTFSGWLLYED